MSDQPIGAPALIAEQSTDFAKSIDISEAIAEAVAAGKVRVVTRREGPILPRVRTRDEDIPIALTTATSLKSAERQELDIKNLGPEWNNRIRDDKIEEAERRDTISVALAQPHRQGSHGSLKNATRADSDFARLSTPLGRLCATQRLREGCYEAGDEYDRILRRAKAAKGFSVPDVVVGENPGALSEREIEAIRQAALLREEKISGMLRSIMPRAPRILERLCYDKLDPSPYDEGLIAHCLYKLGIEFNFIDLGINRDKPV